MLIADLLVLDPAEFLPNGAELDLSGAGFQVLDADFGEADVELQMQRQALGELPTDYHPPNTVTALKLGVLAEGEVDLPTAAQQLAQKVGEINMPGTEHWLRRDFEVGGNFAGSLGKRVFKATLAGLGGWQRGESPDVALTLITGPYWYATVEAESAFLESEEGLRHLIFELAEALGTSPGLIRIRVKNTGSDDWRSLILAGESRDMAQDETADTTAAMAYKCADLTPKGGAEVKEVEGIKVVEHDELTAGWLSVLNSKITAEELGHMTHIGTRRVWIRAEAPGVGESGAGDAEVQLKLRWRPLGSIQWSENSIVPLAVVGGYQLYDLGEARPEAAALGDQRWEWELQAQAKSGSGKVRLHVVYPFPTEQFCAVKAVGKNVSADAAEQNSPGTVESIAKAEVLDWSIPANAKTPDSKYARVELFVGEGGALASAVLLAKDFGFEVPASASITGWVATITRNGHLVRDLTLFLYSAGSAIQMDNMAINSATWISSDVVKRYGNSSNTHGALLTPAIVNSSSFGVGLSVFLPYGVQSGTANVDAFNLALYYSIGAEQPRVCFASRSIELRSDGIYRQGLEDDVWGSIIPDGFLPYAAPSGLEGRASRFIVVPSQGDLGELADSGGNALSAQSFVRPAYLFAREAA